MVDGFLVVVIGAHAFPYLCPASVPYLKTRILNSLLARWYDWLADHKRAAYASRKP